MSIGTDKKIPRYFSLAEKLRHDILDNFSSGDRFYSQREIMRECNASLTTVDRALGILCREGLLARRHGKGTFVSDSSGHSDPAGRRGICLATMAEDINGMDDCYLSTLFMSIRGALHDSGLSVIFSGYENLEQTVRTGKCSGVILVIPGDEHKRLVISLKSGGVPLVVIGSQWPDLQVPTVDSDVSEGTRQAVNYLAANGHARIGYVIPRDDSTASKGTGSHDALRERAFRSRMEELGMRVHEEWIIRLEQQIIRDSDHEHLKSIFSASQRPSALIVAIHPTLLPLLAELKAMGISIPKDLSIISWDDPSWAAYMDPPLTVIRQPLNEIGPRAVAKLLEQIEGNRPAAEKEILPVEIVGRGSVKDFTQ